MTERRWRIRLGEAAERDFAAIVQWKAEAFGTRQAQVYRETLLAALAALGAGPDVTGSTARDEVLHGLRTLHVARPGRHFVVYRAAATDTIEVIRILHDAMDLTRHIQPEDPEL